MNNVIEAVVQLLTAAKANGSSPLNTVKSIWWGDPVMIGESDQPALVVHPVSTEYARRGTQYDQKRHTVEIRLVYNVKTFVGRSASNPYKVFSVADAIDKVELLVSQSGTSVLSVCGVIQSNPTLPYTPEGGDPTVAAQDARVTRVNYVFNSARGFPTFEIIVTMEATVIGDRS
jgi:hypothetical protein